MENKYKAAETKIYIFSWELISEKLTVNSLPIALVCATIFNTSTYSLIVRGIPLIFKIINGIINIIIGTKREKMGENKLYILIN
jgi:hypothetical protein